MPGKFKLKDIEKIAKDVSNKAQYPIRDANELVQAFGGENATVDLEGKGHKAAEARQMPADVFPIASEQDFIAKLASLRGGRGDEPEEMPRGKKLDKRPPEAGEPPRTP